jgi:hypothetical protein
MARNPAKAHTTRKGHVPKSKDEGKQPAGKAFIEGGAGPKGLHNRPGLYRAEKASRTKKVPVPAGKVVTKDRKGTARSSKAKG